MVAAKVGGGVLLAGLVGTGGIAWAKPEWLGIGRMPGYYSLSLDNEYSTEKYADATFGGKHKYLLVGVTKSKTFQGSFVESKSSQPWWKWAYKRLKKDTNRTGKWVEVTSGYTDNVNDENEKALNKVCNDAYKKQDTDLNGTSGDFKKSDIWKYCSEGGKQPTTIQEYNESLGTAEDKKEKYEKSNAIGSTNEGKLLSVKDESNDWAWKLKDAAFWLTGFNEQGKTMTEGRFKTAKEKSEKLKDVCAEAYAKAPSEDSAPSNGNKITQADVIKYCSL